MKYRLILLSFYLFRYNNTCINLAQDFTVEAIKTVSSNNLKKCYGS